jgi:hypothetical protein
LIGSDLSHDNSSDNARSHTKEHNGRTYIWAVKNTGHATTANRYVVLEADGTRKNSTYPALYQMGAGAIPGRTAGNEGYIYVLPSSLSDGNNNATRIGVSGAGAIQVGADTNITVPGGAGGVIDAFYDEPSGKYVIVTASGVYTGDLFNSYTKVGTLANASICINLGGGLLLIHTTSASASYVVNLAKGTVSTVKTGATLAIDRLVSPLIKKGGGLTKLICQSGILELNAPALT